jgi:hypothetical protein
MDGPRDLVGLMEVATRLRPSGGNGAAPGTELMDPEARWVALAFLAGGWSRAIESAR